MRYFLIGFMMVALSACGSDKKIDEQTMPTEVAQTPQAQPPTRATSSFLMKSRTPIAGNRSGYEVRSEILEGTVATGDMLDIIEKSGRRTSVKVKAIMVGPREVKSATKREQVAIIFDGDSATMQSVAMDSYLVNQGGSYPANTDTPTKN